MERAAFQSAWRDKKLHGLILGITAASGNAATRLESYVTKTGTYAYGVLPEVEDLFERQARELDRKKREALLHQIQQIMNERVRIAPIFDYIWPSGIGPRVAELALMMINPYPWSAPLEDVRLKKS
jgi:ABC-type transport system substrate-binding protein